MLSESADVDGVVARIIRCLQLAPRLPFRVVADVLGVSEQTVARRYRRLVGAGIMRVTAVVDPAALGQSSWTLRIQCRSSGAVSLAQALAQRDDVSWVSLVAGGSEVLCALRARTSEARDELLTQRLPRTAPVLSLSATMVLHHYVGVDGRTHDNWATLGDTLDPEQERTVLGHAEARSTVRAVQPTAQLTRIRLEREDLPLLDALAADGRAGYAALASATGTDVGRVTRRLAVLVEAGAVHFDVDVANEALGFGTSAYLWLTVPPAELDRVGHALAAEREVAYAAAVSGPQNVTAAVMCRDVEHLYSFVTERIGAIPGVSGLEIMPIMRTIKQAGTLVHEGRLAGR